MNLTKLMAPSLIRRVVKLNQFRVSKKRLINLEFRINKCCTRFAFLVFVNTSK